MIAVSNLICDLSGSVDFLRVTSLTILSILNIDLYMLQFTNVTSLIFPKYTPPIEQSLTAIAAFRALYT